MEKQDELSFHDALLEDKEMLSLIDLREFLVKELKGIDGTANASRVFSPITDGLGIQSPPKGKTPPVPPKFEFDSSLPKSDALNAIPELTLRETLTAPVPKAPPISEVTKAAAAMSSTDKEAATKSRATLRQHDDTTKARTPSENDDATEIAQPPPFPSASWARRFQAWVLDQGFVLFLWFIVLLVTSQLFRLDSSSSLFLKFVESFSYPVFIRYAVFEFIAIWMAFLVIGVGACDMTFGMWVWNLKIGYAIKNRNRFLCKLWRVVFSFILMAPVLSSVILSLRIKGRNLVDWASGTSIYCTSS